MHRGHMEREILKKSEKSHISESDKASVGNVGIGRNRELNPALFGEPSAQAKVLDGSAQSQLPHLMQTEQKVNEMKTQLGMMAEHVGKLTEQFTEFAKSSQIKFERIQQYLQKLEQNDHQIVSEATQKFSQINTRLGERKSTDNKIHEMVDRHNSVLKSFEMRLTQMQKLIMEKEAQLLTAQAALNEAKMEIARLKRL
jgi:hypothetical protein